MSNQQPYDDPLVGLTPESPWQGYGHTGAPTFRSVNEPPPPKSGKLGLVLGPLLALAGLGGGLVLLLTSLLPMATAINRAPQFSMAQAPVTLTLPAGETQGLWVHGAGLPIQCTVTDPTGVKLPWRMPGGNMQINQFDLSAEFTPTVTGAHIIDCPQAAGDFRTLAIAPPLNVGHMVGAILGGVGLILGGIFGGLLWLIITLVRRSRWNSRYGANALHYN